MKKMNRLASLLEVIGKTLFVSNLHFYSILMFSFRHLMTKMSICASAFKSLSIIDCLRGIVGIQQRISIAKEQQLVSNSFIFDLHLHVQIGFFDAENSIDYCCDVSNSYCFFKDFDPLYIRLGFWVSNGWCTSNQKEIPFLFYLLTTNLLDKLVFWKENRRFK